MNALPKQPNPLSAFLLIKKLINQDFENILFIKSTLERVDILAWQEHKHTEAR